jgi:hypothetical protein
LEKFEWVGGEISDAKAQAINGGEIFQEVSLLGEEGVLK